MVGAGGIRNVRLLDQPEIDSGVSTFLFEDNGAVVTFFNRALS